MAHPLVVNKRTTPFEVNCARGSDWGNPWTHLPLAGTRAKHQVKTREESIEKHREWFLTNKIMLARAKRELRGRILGCYCAPQSCHCDILALWSNSSEAEGKAIIREFIPVIDFTKV